MNPEARPPWVLDTPTLKGVYYTAPYFHDGSAPTLYDVLEREGSRMGKTSHLTHMQKQQLIAYLLTL
jgi:cytochrome c peroxidase